MGSHECANVFIILLLILTYVSVPFSITQTLKLEWLHAVKITQINSCCKINFTTIQYISGRYEFYSEKLTSTCCGNISADDYSNQMDTTIGTAQSILSFIRAFPFLIIVHHFVMPWFVFYCGRSVLLIKVLIAKTAQYIMVLLTAVSITCAVVYATIYIDKIGFTFGDLGSGWILAAISCVSSIIIDLEWTTWRCWYWSKRSHTNENVITLDDWTFVKHGNRNVVLDISTDQTTVFDSPRDRELVLGISTISGDSVTIHQNNIRTNYAMQNIFKTFRHNCNIVETNKTSTDEIINNFQIFINAMWNPHLVGIGADAHYLSHTSLKVIFVKPGYNDCNFLIQKHIRMRHGIQNTIKRLGPLPCLADVDCKPIQTTEFIEGTSVFCRTKIGLHQLDSRLNEYVLFHGTSEANAESILKSGFDTSKARRSLLGRGIYFTESPVKADQYIGASTIGCMLVCRVILGNFIIRKTHPGYELTRWTKLPCSRCFLDVACKQHHLSIERFDSLIYDNPNGLFREFVVFNPDQILVQSVVKYNRVTNTDIETNFR